MTEFIPGPSGPGSVVLDLGPGTGALILHAPPELDGAEIEVSLTGDETRRRTHSRVRRRQAGRGAQYAAVYPGLPAGEYVIWRDARTPLATVTVGDGAVATARWPG